MSHVLDEVHEFIGRFVAYPSEHAHTAHALWIAHCHLVDRWDTTPRIAFLSPEPGSGKSRCIEVTGPLVPRAVHAVNVSAAYLFRKIGNSEEEGPPTILYDEVDAVFNSKGSGDNEDIRGLLNAGHRRGAVAGRCVIRGKSVETEDLPVYSACALAGLGNLPDTLMTRAVIIRMRRRAPNEHVEQWRARLNEPEAYRLAEKLMVWASKVPKKISWPDIPDKIQDRDADNWEALLAVADLVGGEWPERARVAAVALVAAARERPPSLGLQLLRDVRRVFRKQQVDRMWSKDIVNALTVMPETPWDDLRGKPLDQNGLSRFITKYGIHTKDIRIGDKVAKGYYMADLVDSWIRYLPEKDEEDEESAIPGDGYAESAEPSVPSSIPQDAATAATPATRLTVVPTQDTCRDCGQPAETGELCADCREIPHVAEGEIA